MTHREPSRPGAGRGLALAVALGAALAAPRAARASDNLLVTKHNLSTTGTGEVRALSESRVCVFCHTPHNGAPRSPLWNKALDPQVYELYTSPTLRSGPLAQPWGATKLCLTCHDGTLALGAVLNPVEGVAMLRGGRLSPGSLSSFGLDLSGHHPVSFPYRDALPNDELATPPPELTYGSQDEVHCTTCHDPHDDQFGKFLLKDNRYSALCTTCHQMTGWAGSAHATSTASVAGILPRPPKTWPTWGTVGEWGCEVCHTPHFAPTAEQLLNFTDTLPDPFSCIRAGCHATPPPPAHGTLAGAGGAGQRTAGDGTPSDIARQVGKASAHRMPAAGSRDRSGTRSGVGSAACSDCHNPHVVTNAPAEAPYVPGTLAGVAGVDRNGARVEAARYEYELCFRCHADQAPDMKFVPRVVSVTNTRRAFDPGNASAHPVVGMGRNLDVPSIPSRAEPRLGASSMIYCTDCHADDEGGAQGPHGSAFAPILRARYETAGGAESADRYALCYRCHERTSILADTSFRTKTVRRTPSGGGHRGHLAAGAPCSACHDPHGVAEGAPAGPSATGSHTHLINFDTRLVTPLPGRPYPTFRDTGSFTGSCNLVCHGVTHAEATYP